MVVGNNGIWGLEKHPMQAMYGYDVAADLQPGLRYDTSSRRSAAPARRSSARPTSAPRCSAPSPPACPTSSTSSPTPTVAYPRSTLLA